MLIVRRVIRKIASVYERTKRATLRLLKLDLDSRVLSFYSPLRRNKKGDVLISYALWSLVPDAEHLDQAHTQHWEVQQIVKTFLDLGYDVDVIHFTNMTFKPKKHYQVFFGVMWDFERVARRLKLPCIKIYHATYAHWLDNNHHNYVRNLELKRRRGFSLLPWKLVQPSHSPENADFITVLGNEYTMKTYEHCRKPMFRVPIPTSQTFDWPQTKNFGAVRQKFVWFGSTGLVHKGLDVVLEAFANLPSFQLTVCGDVDCDSEFRKHFHKELYETSNIVTRGWVDVASKEFVDLANEHVAVLLPSCSEGGGGGVIVCMHAGMIPIVSYEASVDVSDDYGIVLKEISVEEIQRVVQEIAELPEDTLIRMSRMAWQHVRSHHSRENFSMTFKAAVEQMLQVQP